MKHNVRSQTVFVTFINGFVRGLGLLLRVFLSRTLGAEIMGVAELAQSVHILAITPLTSGLPLAVSRMTAKASWRDKEKPLLAGVWLVRAVAAVMIPALVLLSPALARLMGDIRVTPSLWFSAPCILILGYSGVFNGYCYGIERSAIPAMSELIEQVTRLMIAISLVLLLSHLTPPWMAAVPVFATMASEIIGLAYVLWMLKIPVRQTRSAAHLRKPVFQLAAPTTLSRLTTTLLRSLEAIIIPARLQASGLSAVEATARLGMYNGMIAPILLMPCVFTSALTMVLLPRIALTEERPKALVRLLLKCLWVCLAVAAGSWAAIWLGAPILALRVYRMAELCALFRRSAFLAFFYALSHVSSGVLAALGQQKLAMLGAIPVSVVTLSLIWLLTAMPAYRLNGVIWAQAVEQTALILWNGLVLWRWFLKRRQSAR